MTGADLTRLRWAYALGSATRLANRIGCHPCTIYRNERRDTVTSYVLERIANHEITAAFLRGLNWRER